MGWVIEYRLNSGKNKQACKALQPHLCPLLQPHPAVLLDLHRSRAHPMVAVMVVAGARPPAIRHPVTPVAATIKHILIHLQEGLMVTLANSPATVVSIHLEGYLE